jgi:glycosyltransferase involved in cell wall biosynthesis
MTHLSVVIPVYNESSLIRELVKRVKNNLEIITRDFEIILVDDGSIDQTWELIEIEAKQEKRITGIKFSRNFGHHFAITAGIDKSKGEWVIVMDGDLQDRPEVIPELYNKAQEGFDVVFVSRKNRPEKIYYKMLQRLFYIVLRVLSGINFDSSQANFSIINKKVVLAFREFPETARFYGSTIRWLGFKRTSIYADHGRRFSGKPSYTYKKRIQLALDIIVSFSERPLKFAIGLGLGISLLSIFLTIWKIFSYFNSGYDERGWLWLILFFMFISGAILIILGIIGIYLGKVFGEVKNRPLYIIDKTLNYSIS